MARTPIAYLEMSGGSLSFGSNPMILESSLSGGVTTTHILQGFSFTTDGKFLLPQSAGNYHITFTVEPGANVSSYQTFSVSFFSPTGINPLMDFVIDPNQQDSRSITYVQSFAVNESFGVSIISNQSSVLADAWLSIFDIGL